MPVPPQAGCVQACPGCAHRGWSAADSLDQKHRWLQKRLAPWSTTLAPARAPAEDQRWGYRDKVQLACGWNQGWQFGLRVRDELIPIPRCPVHSGRVRALIALLTPVLPAPERFALAYLVQSGAQAVLVLKQATEPPLNWLDESLIDALQQIGIEGLWIHLHPCAGKKVYAKKGWIKLWGAPRSRDEQGLWYGPAAFQQLIPALYRNALDEAERHLAADADSLVLDLYCGGGSTLRRWAAGGADTLGVETVAEAIACARLNAPTAELLRGTCQHRVPQLAQWTQARSGRRPLLYTNPPRPGMEPEVTAWIGQSLRPLRIAYLSCSAGTLARDLTALGDDGYRVERLIPYDFFPQTYHVETLALLSRVD